MNFVVAGAIFLVTAIWSVWAFQELVLPIIGINWDAQRLGLWGDSFGALNSLFASLGFVAAMATLRLQQREIARARHNQQKENFDKSFFQLLELFREARNEVRVAYPITPDLIIRGGEPDAAYGLEGFLIAWNAVVIRLKKEGIGREYAAEIYIDRVHSKSEATLGPYFRLFYTILIRIKNDASLTDDEKIYYGNLFRAQLSSHEIGIAALNALADFSADLSSLISEFRLLKYTSGTRRSITERYYPPEAFQGRD